MRNEIDEIFSEYSSQAYQDDWKDEINSIEHEDDPELLLDDNNHMPKDEHHCV